MISVCLASYNGMPYISEQVESILFQLNQDDELVISDDGSNDGTLIFLKNLNDQRIKIVSNKSTGHPKDNFANALKYVSGDFIFLSDQDDIWVDGKVIKFLEALESHELVLSNAKFFGDINQNSLEMYTLYPRSLTYISNLYKNSFVGCNMAFRKSLLKKILPFPCQIPMHDSWIGNIALKFNLKIKWLEEVLLKYRVHENNFSNTSKKRHRGFRAKIVDRVNMHFAVRNRLRLLRGLNKK